MKKIVLLLWLTLFSCSPDKVLRTDRCEMLRKQREEIVNNYHGPNRTELLVIIDSIWNERCTDFKLKN